MRLPSIISLLLLLNSGAAFADQDEKFSAGDLVAVNVFSLLAPSQDYAETRQISPDGTIRVPHLGALNFAGLTPEDARKMVESTILEKHWTAHPQVRIALVMPAAEAPAKVAPLKPGDVIVVRIPELIKAGENYTAVLKVGPSGEISVPSAGLLKVEGMRTDEVESALAKKLEKVLYHAEELIRVDRFENAMIRAFGHEDNALLKAWVAAATKPSSQP